MASTNDWVKLKVGGQIFETTRTTLCTREPSSMLARMFCVPSSFTLAADSTGHVLIDRSGLYFEIVLNYLRHGKLVVDRGLAVDGVREEAQFFSLPDLLKLCDEYETLNARRSADRPLARTDVIRLLAAAPMQPTALASSGECRNAKPVIRLQGVDLSHADLSHLDLRRVNFRHANLEHADLSNANLSESDLSFAHMRSATLDGASMACVNLSNACLEDASMRACNFEDGANELPAYLEGANLKNANLEGSHMFRAELRVASLKGALMRNCDLRRATLAGADLENCDLTGSDLQEANLRGANFTNAIFEAMRTPLHMSQMSS